MKVKPRKTGRIVPALAEVTSKHVRLMIMRALPGWMHRTG